MIFVVIGSVVGILLVVLYIFYLWDRIKIEEERYKRLSVIHTEARKQYNDLNSKYLDAIEKITVLKK